MQGSYWKRLIGLLILAIFGIICGYAWILSQLNAIPNIWAILLTALFLMVGVIETGYFGLFPLPPLSSNDSFSGPSDTQVQPQTYSTATTITNIPPNPVSIFHFNEPLPNQSAFYARKIDRQTLVDRTSKKASTSIIGARRIGKTWLMNYLKMFILTELGPRYRFVNLDASADSVATVARFTAKVIKELGYGEHHNSTLAELESVVESLAQNGRIPVLCIDEFEGFKNRQEFNLSFFRGLRAIALKGLVLVIISKNPLIDIIGSDGTTSDFFNVFEQLELEPFNREEAEEFAQDKSRKAYFTELDYANLLKYGCVYGLDGVEQWPPLRLQLVGKMLIDDKIHNNYHPNNIDYWRFFEQKLRKKYEAVIR